MSLLILVVVVLVLLCLACWVVSLIPAPVPPVVKTIIYILLGIVAFILIAQRAGLLHG